MESWAAQFLLTPAPSDAGEGRVHLLNRLSGGCINHLSGHVRGHRDSSPRTKAAPPSASTELLWEEQVVAEGSSSDCRQPLRVRFRFTSGEGGHHLASKADGALQLTSRDGCSRKKHACDFDILPVQQSAAPAPAASAPGAAAGWSSLVSRSGGWVTLRSVRTGKLVRLHHSEMPEEPSWLGIHTPRARPKRRPPSRKPLSAVALAAGGQTCPIQRGGGPSGWKYDPALWAPLIDAYLAPWADGNLSATVLDMAFWPQMYGSARAHALPGVHASIKDGHLYFKQQARATAEGCLMAA